MPELSGLEIAVLAKEVRDRLRGAYVNNIYSLGETQVIRFRRSDSEDVLLVVSPKYGAWLSRRVAERAETSEFTTKLRQQVGRYKLASAEQVDLDRVLVLDFSEPGRTRKLILEMMPPGNIIVTGDDNKIVLALNQVRSQKRRIVVGERYSPPPQNRISPDKVTAADLTGAMKRGGTLGMALGKNVALPRKYVLEVLTRLGFVEGDSVGKMEGRTQDLAEGVSNLVLEARSAPHPTIAGRDKGIEVYAIRPESQSVVRDLASISEAADEVILPFMLEEMRNQKVSPDERRVKELEATGEQLRKNAEQLARRAQEIRKIATTIASRSSEQAVMALSEASDLIPKEATVGVREDSPPAAIASTVFSYAKKLETEARDALDAAEGMARKVKRTELKPPRRREKIRVGKKDWYEKFRWFYTSRGHLAIGGRDAQSNSIIIRRHLEKDDTVYHADLFGSPFFVLKRGHEQTEDEVMEVSQATASFSSAWKTGLSAAGAYWVLPPQISSAAPSGEYIAHGSFMILGKKNAVPNNLIELAIGIEASGRVISGPESAIRKQALAYVVLRPDREKVSDTAKKLMKELESMVGRKLRDTLSLDELIHMLPPGGGKLVRKRSKQKDKSESGPEVS